MKAKPFLPEVAREQRLQQWFEEQRDSPHSCFATMPLTNLIDKLTEENIDLSKISVYINSNTVSTIALPNKKPPDIEMTTESGSIMDDHYTFDSLIDSLAEDVDDTSSLEYRFITDRGRYTFTCADKTEEDFRAWVAALPDETLYSVTDVFRKHPTCLCHRYTLTNLGLYVVTMHLSDGRVW